MRKKLQQKGFILPLFLITTLMISIIIMTIAITANSDYRLSSRETYKVNAQFAADAGLDKALVDLTNTPSWTGSGGEITVLDDGKIKTTYTTTLLSGASPDKKILSVVAKTYSPTTSATPKITRKYEMDVQAVTSGFGASSVVTGVGGLTLSNNAKISGGDVVVNGKVTLSNNAQIGLTTNPVNVRVAHQSCPSPPNATYPQICASGENGQPISMGNNSRIYGNVQATNQTNGTNMSNPGLIAGSTFAPIALPTYDREAQKAGVTITRTPAQVACSSGSATWPANLKITGDVTLGNNCNVTVQGNVWITGRVNMGNNSRFTIASSVGTTRPTMMIDGQLGINFGNNAQVVPNASSTGMQIITFYSRASCSPDCTSVTGSDLYDSQDDITINLSNNGNAPNTILWARWTQVTVSNNGALGAVTGQTVALGNNAVINFTASVPGSDNLITTWVKRGYMRVYN